MQVPSNKLSRGTFTFRRWSRQSYAVFRSLGNEIRIAGLTLAVAAVMLPKNGQSQQQDTTISENIDMDEVVVTAQRNEVLYSEIARTVEVLDAEQIRQLPVQSVNELLEYAFNVDIRQRGGMDVQADVSVRAGSFDQVMILLNGVNITDPQTGHHSLNLPVDLSAIKRIEILSGPGSRIFGPHAFSGAINIITGKTKANSIDLAIAAGEHLYAKTSATVDHRKESVSHFAAASYARSDGYRKNTDFNIASAFYQFKLSMKQTNSLDFQAGYNTRKFGANSFYTPAYPEQFEDTRTKFAALTFKTGRKIKSEARAYWRRHNDRFELFRNDAPDWYSGHNYHMSDVFGLSVSTMIPVKRGRISLGAEYRYEGIKSNVLGEPVDDTIKAPGEDNGFFFRRAERENISAFAEYAASIGKLNVVGGVMANFNKDISDQLKFFPGLDINYKVSEKIHIYTSASYGMRLPSFTDLYYQGPSNVGNPDLVPEESAGVETGVKYFHSKHNFRLSGFYREGTNIIDWVKQDENDIWKTTNLTELNTRGLSAKWHGHLNRIFDQDILKSLTLSYSFAHQEKEHGQLLSRYALDYLKHKINARLTHSLVKDVEFSWTATWQDRAGGFILYDNGTYGDEVPYDPYLLLDAKVSWKISDVLLYIEVANALDNRYYDIGNVIQPGRWIRAGVQWNISLK